MRVSTSMIYDKGVGSIQQQWKNILQTQQQVSTGRRVLTPADDPIASARALELGQTKAVNSQFSVNIGYADDAMKLLESRLQSAGSVLQYARERAVQAGNGTLASEDLRYMAADMKAQFEAMLALANSQDGTGDYIFGGYRSQQQPYSGGLSGVAYNGDQGERSIQVSASRYMAVSLPGSDVFDRTLALSPASIKVYSSTGAAGADGPAVTAVDASAVREGTRYQFEYDALAASYSVTRIGQDGQPVAPSPGSFAIGSTPTIDGITFDLSATPAASPAAYEVFVPSTNLLNNMAMFAAALEKPGVSGMTGAVAFALETFDAGQESLLRTRAQIGSQLTETEALANLGSDLDLQYATTLSGLQDVDYAEAISRLTQQQTYLQAAQQSFMRVSGLSLFNYLN
ncbi:MULTISPECIES: flagellar hook-associated protein FlgL [unclassified Thauera]|uniref:flagellar hook-associated protein FlgL n=1 Tax=unclassified Thauera TaxID=2609274 RepID=UPI0002D06A3A|nr:MULTISPECIES: flagellar hook-associated protein FlgL [unclassified Thauera]ENO94885.1 flagellar hook-filament junction protein 3 [Thauera sp. 28]HAG76692.1 flagellar hook-associated protein 3 [Thauera sp.]HNR60313.1 flagellar hook-associated protein FlgL [Thauera sp.]HNS91929.1 flagellar hook-associated protein FlgL [Thauera sp.]HRK11683.1 flagellar hook-associated protein FlgL [Thauera sp.]